MKIYTKTGDKGETSLLGGVRVPKHHLRIEAYGTTDELNAYIGYCRSCFSEQAVLDTLAGIQDRIFTLGSHLASDPKSRMIVPDLAASDIEHLEAEMDRMEEVLPELKNFILPGGSKEAAMIHVARCVCRRAERLVSQLKEEAEVESLILQYLNRLSDYLFVLGRYYVQQNQLDELVWTPRK